MANDCPERLFRQDSSANAFLVIAFLLEEAFLCSLSSRNFFATFCTLSHLKHIRTRLALSSSYERPRVTPSGQLEVSI